MGIWWYTTVVGEIAALDTQVKANADAIATLNGEETAAGSVKHTAKTYVDEALNWIDAGTYGTEA